MSSKKKSFLLHIDSLDILDDLTNGQAGVLFKAIKAYQHKEDFPLDSVVKIAFSPFKNQFFRDDEKYVKTCERRAIAGSKGGKQKVANASNSKQEVANVADSNNKNKNKNKTKNKSDNYSNNICQLVTDEYNDKLSELGQVKVLSEPRKAKLKASIKQFKNSEHDFENVETWSRLFDYISTSDFLMGRKSDWSASFDFIINKSNLLKIVEGQYDNK
jgi:hypothetical protein